VVDLETTGLASDPAAEPLELGALLLDPGREAVRTLQVLIRPSGPIPAVIRRLTGLDDEAVAEAPAIEQIAQAVREALSARVLVAHNAPFERHFLTRFVSSRFAEAPYLDTQDLLALTHPDAPDLRLESFSRELLGREERHRALEDALDTARILSRIAQGAQAGEARYANARGALEGYAPDSPWLALLGKREAPPSQAADPFVEIGSSLEPPVAFDEEAIAAVLRDDARARRYFPGYRRREAQVRLAGHFVRVLRDGGVLLLEGGTGVGKSLAYLAAAIPFAIERARAGIREPVVISTRTKLLQDQLLAKDIPAAARLLGYPELRALSIKGRANYACARRIAGVLAEGQEPRIFPEDRLAYAALAACASTRPWGEVGAVPAAWLRRYPALGDLLRRSVTARAEQCTREQCAAHGDCPLGLRRQALTEAHLVVANHDLLLRWPPDYPCFSHAIADEVHEITDIADEVYALEVRPSEILERFDQIFGRPDGPGGRDALLPVSKRRAAHRDARAWRRGLQQDLVALGRSFGDLVGDFGEVQVPERPDASFAAAARLSETTAQRLEQVASGVETWSGGEALEPSPLERATTELREAAQALRLALQGAGEDSVAVFEGVEPPWDTWRLVVRAVSPAAAFHECFLDRLRSFAGVSASLFVGGDAFAALGELELESRARDRLVRVSEPSPFPYAEHMRVVALAEGGNLVDETTRVLERLARRLGGRTLGLFTSVRRMQEVAALLSERLRPEGIQVLAPRRARDDPNALVERFCSDPAVLLGARKFWQGLDIPGMELQAVAIEKLPFEVPTELRRRRELRLRREGINAFERYTLGKMLLNLKQMVGRLIRSEEDRGLVVIVEARPDRTYFERLKDALPPGCRVMLVAPEDFDAQLAEVGIAERSSSQRAIASQGGFERA
jgi:ATP-dependent DNA helicase DinG